MTRASYRDGNIRRNWWEDRQPQIAKTFMSIKIRYQYCALVLDSYLCWIVMRAFFNQEALFHIKSFSFSPILEVLKNKCRTWTDDNRIVYLGWYNFLIQDHNNNMIAYKQYAIKYVRHLCNNATEPEFQQRLTARLRKVKDPAWSHHQTDWNQTSC